MDKYGLIGYPLGHSFSVTYFNEKFQSENIDAEYVNFEIPRIEDFMEVIDENPDLRGLNVTIPYKEQVIPYLDELDKDTAKIGAVNVIKIIRQGKGKVKLVGYNSDIIGFTQSIEPLLRPHHKRALVLGTGGAAKAVYHGLENLGIESTYVSRTKRSNDVLTYQELTPEVMAEHTVIHEERPHARLHGEERARDAAAPGVCGVGDLATINETSHEKTYQIYPHHAAGHRRLAGGGRLLYAELCPEARRPGNTQPPNLRHLCLLI